MRIQIKSAEKNLNIVLPTKLIFGRWVVFLANTVGRRYAGEHMDAISPDSLNALFAEFRRIKDRYGKYELVDIESAAGEKVKIIL